jgi:hypothetical protein
VGGCCARSLVVLLQATVYHRPSIQKNICQNFTAIQIAVCSAPQSAPPPPPLTFAHSVPGILYPPARDAKKQREQGPFVMAQVKNGVVRVVDTCFIQLTHSA